MKKKPTKKGKKANPAERLKIKVLSFIETLMPDLNTSEANMRLQDKFRDAAMWKWKLENFRDEVTRFRTTIPKK